MVIEMIHPSELRNRYLGPNIALLKICTLKLQAASFPELLVGLSVNWSTLRYFRCLRPYITSTTMIKLSVNLYIFVSIF